MSDDIGDRDLRQYRINKREAYFHICRRAIENTARRLGVDPVAFAEACEDGTFLADAVLVADALGQGQAHIGHAELTTHQLAKLKRTEPST